MLTIVVNSVLCHYSDWIGQLFSRIGRIYRSCDCVAIDSLRNSHNGIGWMEEKNEESLSKVINIGALIISLVLG